MKIYLVIHVSNLKPYHPNMENSSCNQPIRPKVILIKLEKKVVEKILVERELIMRGCRRREFLVEWRDLGDEEISQEKEDDLSKFKKLIEAFQVAESMRMSTN